MEEGGRRCDYFFSWLDLAVTIDWAMILQSCEDSSINVDNCVLDSNSALRSNCSQQRDSRSSFKHMLSLWTKSLRLSAARASS
jgi:hypothetical protein